MKVVLDIETDDLNATEIFCIVAKERESIFLTSPEVNFIKL